MKKDRAYARELSGRILGDKLLMETADAYQTIPDSAAVYQSTEEYQKNARKYSSIYSLARQVYDTPNVRFGAPEMGTLDPARAEQFYEIRELCMTKQIENAPISENAKEVMMQYSAEVKEPWIFSYSDGYTPFYDDHSNLRCDGCICHGDLSGSAFCRRILQPYRSAAPKRPIWKRKTDHASSTL